MKHVKLFEAFVNERADYKYKKDSKYSVKATVCYIDPARGKRICKDLYFKSKMDALGFKDNVKGFPKGAEVEAINEAKLGTLKKFLQDFKAEHGKGVPSEQTLAQFIYDNYEDITGEKLKNSDPESNDHIADIVAHFKMDGEDFMIAWEDTVNANK